MNPAHGMAYAAVRHMRPGASGSAGPAPKPKYGDALFEGTSYPRTWGEYVGQERAKQRLRAAINSAAVQNRRLDHILISAPSAGIGKTALALLTAHELGVGVLEVSGRMDAPALKRALRGMDDHDVLFVDEIHRLVDGGKRYAEPFLHILQDGMLLTPTGPVEIPDVTVIGATTDKQRLDDTVLDRFKVQPVLVDYTEDEAVKIAAGKAKGLGFGRDPLPWGPDREWLARIARAGNCNPRKMENVLIALRDSALAADELPFDGRCYHLTEALDWCQLTEDGLDVTAQAYLLLLAGAFEGVAGERTLAAALGERAGVKHTEKLLMAKGLIGYSPRGRALTNAGWTRAAALASMTDQTVSA